MRLKKNIFMSAAMVLLGITSIQATEHEGEKAFTLSKFAIQMLSKSMPEHISAAIKKQKVITQTKASDQETPIDSVVYVKGGVLEYKLCYTYYDNGDVKSVTKYLWDAQNSRYYPSSYQIYGEGGVDAPAYVIEGKYDEDGMEMPETRIDYDWTKYQELDESIDVIQWDHAVKLQNYVNGLWETESVVTPQIQDSRLLGLVFKETDEQGNLEQAYSVEYQYDADGRLINMTNKSNQDEEPVKYEIKYDDEGHIDWYGTTDGSWYREYFYGDNFDNFTEYEVIDGKAQTLFVSGIMGEMSDPKIEFFNGQIWKIEEDAFYHDDELSYKDVYLTSMDENNLYVVSYQEDDQNNRNDLMGVRIGYNNKDVETEFYTYTEDKKWVSDCVYSLKTENLDDYTQKQTFYDELGIPSYSETTYRHNPNPTGLKSVIKNSRLKDGKMYDLSGRMVSTKSGVRIVNGKKVIF